MRFQPLNPNLLLIFYKITNYSIKDQYKVGQRFDVARVRSWKSSIDLSSIDSEVFYGWSKEIWAEIRSVESKTFKAPEMAVLNYPENLKWRDVGWVGYWKWLFFKFYNEKVLFWQYFRNVFLGKGKLIENIENQECHLNGNIKKNHDLIVFLKNFAAIKP